MRAARYAGIATWELEAQPYARTLEYLEAEKCELAAQAELERQRAARANAGR